MNELNIIKTLSHNLSLISEKRITEDIFYTKKARVLFEKLKKQHERGFTIYEFNNFDQSQIKNAKNILKENFDAVKNEVTIETKKLKFKDDLNTAKEHLDKKGTNFNLNETISNIKKQFDKRSSVESDKKEVFSTKDEEFDKYKQKILDGNFSFVSNIKTDEWKCFDKGMRGLRPNKSTILSANTGIGKTAFSINMARLVSSCKEAKENNKYSLFINLEMEAEELYHRIICAIAELTLEEFEKAHENKTIADKIKKAHEEFKELNMYITSDTPRTVEELQYIIDKYNSKDELCLVIIDYLGKIKNRNKEQQKEYQKLFEWVAYLNEKRKEKGNYHLWILSQLSREGEKSDNPSSRESVSGSYAILQDVDTVLTIIPSSEGFILKNEKNRGARDNWMVNFDFRKNIQKFVEINWATKDDIKKKNDIEDLDF